MRASSSLATASLVLSLLSALACGSARGTLDDADAASSPGARDGGALAEDGGLLGPSDGGGTSMADARARDAGNEGPISGRTAAGIVASYTHACAWSTDGHVACWGANGLKEVGDGTTTDRNTPYELPNISDVKSVAVGDGFSCAIRAGGTVWCWGRAPMIGLGVGGADSAAPVQLSGLTDIVELGANRINACARTSKGAVYCWGANSSNGQVTSADFVATPTIVPGLGPTVGVRQVTVGAAHRCVRFDSGIAQCWGDGQAGRLGTGTEAYQTSPTLVLNLTNVTHIAAGTYGTCAVASGGVHCWGTSSITLSGASSAFPVAIAGLPNTESVIVGGGAACARDTSKALRCWDAEGTPWSLPGNGTMNAQTTPGTPVGLGAVSSATSADFNGGAIVNGVIYMWGDNSRGAVGDGTFTTRLVPTKVSW